MAGFIGSPKMNFLAGELIEIGEDKCKVKLSTGDIITAVLMLVVAKLVIMLNWVFVQNILCQLTTRMRLVVCLVMFK